jgi:hypothetical protein
MYRPRSRPCRANGKIKSGAPRRAVGDGKGLCSRDAVRLDLDALAKREAGCRVRYSAERVIDLHGRGAQELHDDVAAIQVQRARSADGASSVSTARAISGPKMFSSLRSGKLMRKARSRFQKS